MTSCGVGSFLTSCCRCPTLWYKLATALKESGSHLLQQPPRTHPLRRGRPGPAAVRDFKVQCPDVCLCILSTQVVYNGLQPKLQSSPETDRGIAVLSTLENMMLRLRVIAACGDHQRMAS